MGLLFGFALHFIVTHFFADANKIFAKSKIFFSGRTRNFRTAPILFQILSKNGAVSLPMAVSQQTIPVISPQKQPIRMSPRQRLKFRYSQIQPKARINSPSARCRCFRPGGFNAP